VQSFSGHATVAELLKVPLGVNGAFLAEPGITRTSPLPGA